MISTPCVFKLSSAFGVRDAKQYWGLDDFMNVKEVAVTNAANLSFFMVNFSSILLQRFRENNPEFSILDLKSHYRGCRYVSETIKLLPRLPDKPHPSSDLQSSHAAEDSPTIRLDRGKLPS